MDRWYDGRVEERRKFILGADRYVVACLSHTIAMELDIEGDFDLRTVENMIDSNNICHGRMHMRCPPIPVDPPSLSLLEVITSCGDRGTPASKPQTLIEATKAEVA